LILTENLSLTQEVSVFDILTQLRRGVGKLNFIIIADSSMGRSPGRLTSAYIRKQSTPPRTHENEAAMGKCGKKKKQAH